MTRLGETLSTEAVDVEGETQQAWPLGAVLTTQNVRIYTGSYERLGQILSTVELWAGEEEEGMLVRRDASCAEIFLPTAPPVTITSGAGTWVAGSWVSLGSHGSILVPSYVHIANYIPPAGMLDFAAELALGDAKTPLDAMREQAPFYLPGANTLVAYPHSMMCQPIAIPADTVVYARAIDSSSSALPLELFLVGWSGGLPTFASIPLQPIAGPGRWYPANATSDYILVTGGTSWAWGSSVTVVASAPNDMLVVGIELYPMLEYLMAFARGYQIGYGPEGEETWCATLTMGRTWTTRWVWPPVQVKAGERLAVRATASSQATNLVRVKVYDL